MKKKTAGNGQAIPPAAMFEKALDAVRYQKTRLTKQGLDKAEKDGEGLFRLETVYEPVFSGGSPESVPGDAKKEVLRFMDQVRGLYKSGYTEDELKAIAATGVVGAVPPRTAAAGNGVLNWKSAEKSYSLAYGFKISLLQKELEEALDRNDIYRACSCCTHICGLWHLLLMLPLNEPVRQMTGRNKELRWKKRKIPESIADAGKILDFYGKERKAFEKQYGTSHGSAKHALASTCEKFNLGPTSIKKVLRTYKEDPAGTRLFETAAGRR